MRAAYMNRRLVAALAGTMLFLSHPAPAQEAAQPADSGPSWKLACAADTVDKPLQCRMVQELFAKETHQRVLTVTVARAGAGQGFELTFALPHGAFLPAGLLLKVDEREPLKMPIEWSNSTGVYARIALDAALEAAIRRGSTMTVGVTNRAGKLIQIPVTLSGFGAGLGRITALR